MKIGIILNKYPISSETFIDTFLKHFDGHKIYLFANVDCIDGLPSNWIIKQYLNKKPQICTLKHWLISILVFPFFIRRFFLLIKNGIPIKQLIAEAPIWTTQKLDILHFPFGDLVFGREHYAELLKAKMTVSFRGSDLNVFPIHHNRSYKQIWPYVYAVHCNSIELQQKLKDHEIPDKIPICIISAALRREFTWSKGRVSKQQPPIGSLLNPLILVTLGRLHWVKDYPFALRIMAGLKEKGVVFQYYILGDGPEKEHLSFLRNELDLENEVIFSGKVTSIDIENYFSRAHIYLQTSHAEGFSNACLEAQAFGLPCVVPAISGMSTCIENNKTGMIIEQRNEDIFIQSIIYVIQNLDIFESSYISSRVKEKFSAKNQRESWLSFFNHIFEEDMLAGRK